MRSDQALEARLAAAGVGPAATPVDAWRRLHEVEGPRATLIDLYDLVAAEQGIAADELPLAERTALARLVLPEVWPGYALTAGSERAPEPVRIADHDPEWPRRFARWHERLTAALGEVALRVEHVGSTSVPGLPAKPVLDLQVSVARLVDEDAYVPPLERCGLQLRSRDDLHRFFRPFPDRPREVHVHVCAAGSAWERDHLLFRDYLRATPHACQAYAAVKREAAARWADDRLAYTDAKSGVILRLMEDARRWARAKDTGRREGDELR